MQPLNIVVAHSDTVAAAELAASLHKHFRSVAVTRSADEVRSAIPKNRPKLAVLDLETVTLLEVEELCREFEGVPVVCTHRLPDEQMWADALAAGAIDVCQTNDVTGIVSAMSRNLSKAQTNAA